MKSIMRIAFVGLLALSTAAYAGGDKQKKCNNCKQTTCTTSCHTVCKKTDCSKSCSGNADTTSAQSCKSATCGMKKS